MAGASRVRYNEGMRVVVACAILLASLGAVPALAQQIEIETPAPPRPAERQIIAPAPGAEPTRPSDADYYPGGGQVGYEPAFIGPASRKIETRTQTGRFGLAGWTSPNTPVGPALAGHGEVSGWFAFGFAITWDGPPPVRPSVR